MRLSIGLAALLLSASGLAQGVVLSPQQLPAPVRTELAAKVAAAKKTQPADFEALAKLRALLPTLDKNKRGRQPALSPLLRSLGPAALYPMIEEAAFSARPRGELKSQSWLAWRLALLEVLGELRSADAVPIFVTLLESAEPNFDLNRIAAGALGERSDDAAAQKLLNLSAGPKRDPVLAGMGSCRRLLTAQTLAAAVSSTTDSAALVRLAKSLGTVGNSWAWQTPSVLAKVEERAVRAEAARALLQIFLKGDAEVRLAASNAVMVVDAEETRGLIEEARRTSSGPALAALDALERRFAANPVR